MTKAPSNFVLFCFRSMIKLSKILDHYFSYSLLAQTKLLLLESFLGEISAI